MNQKTIDGHSGKGEPIPLPDNAKIVIVGGGPAGAFFAIHAAKKARSLGKAVDILIIERKKSLCFYQSAFLTDIGRTCNYCAGSISPRLTDILYSTGMDIPEDIVVGKTELLTIHADWKSIEIPIPPGRRMYSVFRGSKPRNRSREALSFDAFLLDKAREEGAKVISGEVRTISYTSEGRPVVSFQPVPLSGRGIATVDADFVALAAGVNQIPGMELESSDLYGRLGQTIRGFRPPKIRKALISEVETDNEQVQQMMGEMHFAQYGSKTLKIEMSSLIPKGRWVTVVLIGESIEQANPTEYPDIMNRFLELPHIKRLFPQAATFKPICLCSPNMTIGGSQNAFGHRIALIGDMAVSRLYKDGIFSAHTTAASLAETIHDIGIDRHSLKGSYWPVVRKIEIDNMFGSVVFLLNRITFSHGLLSRIFYQAILTERKSKPEKKRRLSGILWRIASGDDTYRRILISMCSPATIWSILSGGLLVTIRNLVAEKVLGLSWSGFGRYPTGVPRESLADKREEAAAALGIGPFMRPPHFERLYSIKIWAHPVEVFEQLGKFGDEDRQYMNPRAIDIYRKSGRANEVGSVICYDFPFGFMSFHMILERVIGRQYLMYHVQGGYVENGFLIFDIHEEKKGQCVLSVYAVFDFPKGGTYLQKSIWTVVRRCFPGFVHDVAWNHSLCKLKHIIETTS